MQPWPAWLPFPQGTFPQGAASQQLEDSDLWKVAEQFPETDLPQTTKIYESIGHSQVSEAIQLPKFLETVWRYQVPRQLQEEESAEPVLLTGAQELGQPQVLEPEPEPKPGPAPGPGPDSAPGPEPQSMSALGPALGPSLTPGFTLAPWPVFRPGTAPTPEPVHGPGPGPGPGPVYGPGPAPGPGPVYGPGPATGPGPGPAAGPGPATGPQAIPPQFWPGLPGIWPPLRGLPVPGAWPFFGLGYSQPGPAPSRFISTHTQTFRAPPPATEFGSAWPRALQPLSQQADMYQLPAVSEQAEDYLRYKQVPRDGALRAEAPKEVPPKGPRSALQRIKTTAAIAAAAAAAYAAAANSAAQAAETAALAVKDAPATKLATVASTSAASGPLGVFADTLGAGSSRGATASFSSTAETKIDDLPEVDYDDLFSAPYALIPPDTIQSQVMLAAKQAVTPEDKKKAVKYSMSHIAQIPIRHDSLKEEFVQLSTNLQQRMSYLGRPRLALVRAPLDFVDFEKYLLFFV